MGSSTLLTLTPSPSQHPVTSSFTVSPSSSLISVSPSGVSSAPSVCGSSTVSLDSPSDLSPSTFSSEVAASFSLASSSAFSSVFDSSPSSLDFLFSSATAASSIRMAFSYSYHTFSFLKHFIDKSINHPIHQWSMRCYSLQIRH